MKFSASHVPDKDLLRYLDGEMPAGEAQRVRFHLQSCWECRAELAELEKGIGAFMREYREQTASRFSSPDGPRALLQARLRALGQSPGGVAPHFHARWTLLPALFCVGALAIWMVWKPAARTAADGARPQSPLTPGETISVTAAEVCSPDFPTEEQTVVPSSMKERVLGKYGVPASEARAFEIDYLINPDLGGATTVRNLWPEPGGSAPWNARVKDQLEARLKHLVCSGQVSLATAQNDLARDWIASYKKYFHSEVPVATGPDTTF